MLLQPFGMATPISAAFRRAEAPCRNLIHLLARSPEHFMQIPEGTPSGNDVLVVYVGDYATYPVTIAVR